jgi:hypothetical protein
MSAAICVQFPHQAQTKMSDDRSDYSVPLTDREILLLVRRDVKQVRELLDREVREIRDTIKDHNRRIAVLENFRWWLVGAIIGSAGLTAALAKLIH